MFEKFEFCIITILLNSKVMKTYLFILLIMVGFSLYAQTYHPFPTKNTLWTEMYFNPYPNEYSEFHCFALKDNDTTINSKLYHKLYHSTDTLFTEANLCGAIREENKRVYYYSINSLTYRFMEIEAKKEYVLYDFSLNICDTIKNDSFSISSTDKLVVFSVDSVLVGTEYRKSYTFAYPNAPDSIPWAVWIEGVGSLRGLLFATGDVPSNGLFNDLICFRQDNVFLYHYDNNNINQYHYDRYNDCYYIKPNAVEMIAANTKIIIVPNPVKTIARIEFEKPDYRKLILTDLYGRTLRGYNIEGKTSIKLSRVGLPNGIYFITIYDKHGNKKTARVIFK